MSAPLKVGMIGLSHFGGFRRLCMRKTGLFEIVSCYDIKESAMLETEKKDGAKPVSSYDELINTPGIEAVVISTGASFHAEQTIAAAKKGLHVFVEKPLCSTPEELKDLIEIQKETGIVIGVGHSDCSQENFCTWAKSLIDSGEIGKVTSFEKTTAHSGGLRMSADEWRADPKKNPGGMLFQCGVHGFHELMYYFGPIRNVQCMMRYDVHTTKTADSALCLVEFESGVTGTLCAYHVTPYRHTLSIYATKTNIYREARCFDEGTHVYTQSTKLDGQYEPWKKISLDTKEKSESTTNLESFYDAVRNGGTPYPSLIDGARAVATVFAAEESAQTGKQVSLEKYLKMIDD